MNPGQPGYQLDIVASVGPIETALKSAGKRDAELVVENQPAPNPGIDQLTLLLQARLAQFPGKTSLFLKDLQTGHEIDLNPHVAYSGLSLTKIALAVEVYRRLDQPPDAQTTALVTETLGLEDSDAAANQLLAMIGDGSAQAGVEDLTSSMHNVGLVDTFMTAAYGVTDTAESLVTPANSNPAAGTVPDPARQTTPTDIGLLLEMIYQCSHSGGALLAVYPDKFTPAECNQMLDLMKQNAPQTTEGVPPLLKGGVPDTVEVAHKLGGDFDTRADAAIMSTPGGDYVLVVFLTTPGQWGDWNVADGVMVDVSRAAYHFFNPTVQ